MKLLSYFIMELIPEQIWSANITRTVL